METTEEKKIETQADRREAYLKSVITNPKAMGGVWELKIEINNSQGTKAFGGRQLTDYVHPLTGINVPLIDLNQTKLLGFMIDRPTMRFHPDSNPMDRRIVDWLIAHPEVGIEGVTLQDSVLNKKDSNPSIKLKNVDRQEMSTIENEDRIDFVIGKLSDDNPKNGISLERLRYLLAYFNLPYFDIRYIKNKTTEKKFLRQKLKNFARIINSDGTINANLINDVLEEIDNLKYSYEFKEMLRYDIIRESFGSYKYNNVPLGSTEESVITWMKNNLEIYTEMVGNLYPRLKADGFDFK
jgi:hypothetical protein